VDDTIILRRLKIECVDYAYHICAFLKKEKNSCNLIRTNNIATSYIETA